MIWEPYFLTATEREFRIMCFWAIAVLYFIDLIGAIVDGMLGKRDK